MTLNWLDYLIIIPYSISLLYIFSFSLSQLHLTWLYTRKKKSVAIPKPINNLPTVTIQLPIYNEKYVVNRLVDAVCKISYPKEKLEIQILDDSTDETSAIIQDKLRDLQQSGLAIHHIQRSDRVGYKAGALHHGLTLAQGDVIAIFDADFIPTPDFLEQTIHYFHDEHVGAVQTRWGHLNKSYSLLTQLQSFGLDAHFSIEQSARQAAGSFINFNGTCGLWRKKTIEQAGGWQFDTLTEDLDLSYRAQLAGWKINYLEHVETPGELPVIMPAIKSQQFRWNKGGAETARKLIGRVWKSDLGFITKLHAFFHLFNSSVFIALLVAALLSIPMLYLKAEHTQLALLFTIGSVFLLGFFSIGVFYWVATKRFHPDKPWKEFLKRFPVFLIVSMGLSLHNGIAVLEGLLGIKTPFVRTPKFNIVDKKDSWKTNDYIKSHVTLLAVVEGILCFYFLFGIIIGIKLLDTGLIVFHAMLSAGFGSIFFFSIKPMVDGKK